MKAHARKFINENLPIDYDTTLFNKAFEWLDDFWFGNQEAVKKMSFNTTFWNWWANQWRIRTEACIYNNGFDLDESNLLDEEKQILLEAYTIAHDIKKNRKIFPTPGMRGLIKIIENET